MNILVFGAKGYMGQNVLGYFGNSAVPSTADIADPAAVAAALDEHKPDAVINLAGKTGVPNVDWCEDHKEETIRSNVTGPLVLLDECGKRGVYWAHLSSGCIYEGDNGGTGWTEEDPPNYSGSFYSRTKAWSDQMLKEFPVLVLRPRMPFDGSNHPRNLITKLSKYTKVLDEPNSITYLPDLLSAMEQLMERRATGLYNVTNHGAISPYRVMELYKEIVDPSHTFERMSVEGLKSVVKAGRSNCILSTKKLQQEGVNIHTAEDAVRAALASMKA